MNPDKASTLPWPRLWACAACLAVMWFSPTAIHAQEVPAGDDQETEAEQDDPAVVRPSIEVDLDVLFTYEKLFVSDVVGPVWHIKPGPGKRLVLLPLRVEPGEQPYDLTSSTVKLRGSRFICWLLVDPDQLPELAAVQPRSKLRPGTHTELDDQRPVVARRFTLQPSGKIQWKLDRFIPGAEVTGPGRAYALKIDSELLNKSHPGDPPRVVRNRGESSPQYLRRRQQKDAAYRSSATRYRELRSQVLALPSDFEDRLPRRVWAVYEQSINIPFFTVAGATDKVWHVSIEQFEVLRELSMGKREVADKDTGRLAGWAIDAIGVMADLANAGNPAHDYSMRAIAGAIAVAGLVSYAQPGDDLFLLLQTLTQSDAAEARRVVLKQLITAIPPTPATRQLLAATARAAIDPQLQLMRLRTLLQADANNPAQVQEMVNSANRMLLDPKGPSPAEVLGELVTAAGNHPAATGMLSGGIRFAALPEDRLADAAGYIVATAGTKPLAAIWLDRGLLASPDPNVALHALRTLDAASTGNELVKPLARSALSFAFGKPPEEPADAPGHPGHPGTSNVIQPIPIASSDHGLFKMLVHDDPDTRGLAWRVLRHFHIQAAESPDGLIDAAADDAYRAILDLGLGQIPTPPQMVELLGREHDEPTATRGLVRVVLQGDARSSALATRSLLHSGRPLDKVLLAMPYEDRYAFALRVYENKYGHAPAVTGLIRQRDEDSPITAWLGRQLVEGNVPLAAVWHDAFGGDEKLLPLIISEDDLLRDGALDALVASAGGEPDQVRDYAERFSRITDPTPVKLQAEWFTIRQAIYARRIKAASGTYRLSLHVRNPDLPDYAIDAEIGRVRFHSDGGSARFTNHAVDVTLSDTQLAIRLDEPQQLASLSSDRQAARVLEQFDESLILELTPSGAWRGEITLSDAAVATVVMNPATP